MISLLIRNYKNAGVRVNVSLCLQRDHSDKQFPALFVHSGTGLEIHNLATAGHRDLLRQAKGSALPRKPGETFEDQAWKVAAYSLVSSAEKLRVNPATQVGMVIPYTCFIAEYLSKNYREKEERDVCISVDGDVFINAIAGLHNDSKLLGNFRQ